MNDTGTLDVLNAILGTKNRTCALYRMVLQVFGPVQPFKSLVQVEQKYKMIAAGLIRRHGGAAPADDWENRVTIPVSFVEACEEAIELEREHAALYRQLLERDVDPATRRILIRIQNVSRNNHQPNFQAYLDFARSGERRVMNF